MAKKADVAEEITAKNCVFDGSGEFRIADAPTSLGVDRDRRIEMEGQTEKNLLKMGELQDRLYADGREGLVILFQAMDAAGKDSTIKHVMGAFNPQGVSVHSFKQPTSTELAHDYLWRAECVMPPRGSIAVFNRSYYEDVLVARVHHLEEGYKMPARCTEDGPDAFYRRRYRQIRDFEERCYEEGYRLVKVFLNVGLDEQKERFLERIDNPAKNWKFSSGDLAERKLWPAYMDAYERTINETASKHAPWYVIPADQKWVTRLLVSQAALKALKDIDPHYPEMPADQRANLAACREQLMSE